MAAPALTRRQVADLVSQSQDIDSFATVPIQGSGLAHLHSVHKEARDKLHEHDLKSATRDRAAASAASAAQFRDEAYERFAALDQRVRQLIILEDEWKARLELCEQKIAAMEARVKRDRDASPRGKQDDGSAERRRP